MDWELVGALIPAAIVSAGGIGAVIIAVIKFSSDMIAQRLKEKYQLELNKELEKYKAQASNKTYVTKVRFDKEFQVYATLWEKFHSMVMHCQSVYGIVDVRPEDRQKIFDTRYEAAVEAHFDAMNTLHGNAVFIPKDIFDRFEKIRRRCNDVILTYEMYGYMDRDYEEDGVRERRRAVDIGMKAREELNALSDHIREYLAALDVLD